MPIYEEKTLIQSGDTKGNEVIHYPITKTECITDLDEYLTNEFELFELKDNSVTTSKIADSSVTTGKLNSLAVTEAKLGTNSVTTTKIADSSVTTGKLNSLAVTEAKLADSSVTSTKISASAVTEAKLGTSSVTTTKIADSSVTSGKLADSSITTGKLADSSVTSDKLNSLAVTEAKLGTSSVTTNKLGSSSVTTAKLADGSVTSAKLGSDVSFDSVKYATIVVGTSTNGHTAKDCDYLCTGTSDQTVINSAISALPSTGGKILLLEGTYNLTGSVSFNKSYCTLQGMGLCTKLVNTSNVTSIYTSSYTTVTNLYCDGGSSAIEVASYCIINNNHLTNNTYGILIKSDKENIMITNNCISKSSEYSIYITENNPFFDLVSTPQHLVSCNHCGNDIYDGGTRNYTDGNLIFTV